MRRQRDLFLDRLEQVRRRYQFAICGYVVMPEHIHLLLTEPRHGNVSTLMQVLKQRVARALLAKPKASRGPAQSKLFSVLTASDAPQFWQRRFYDFNVWTEKKRVEKLRYMHRNLVKRGLVPSPELWEWSSFRYYSLREKGRVKIDAF